MMYIWQSRKLDGLAFGTPLNPPLEPSARPGSILLKAPKAPDRTKYVIILVGLPGRGKTFLCNKIKCYLNW